MRSRSAPRGLRRPLLAIQVLPTVVTAGNLIAGVLAISFLQDAAAAGDPARREALWVRAAWLIFVGMFCDGLDGRIARLTRSTSPFGAQLDSLADVVSFGVAPALLAKTILLAELPDLQARLVFWLAGAYVVGAALRLARYNVESARTAAEGTKHVTMVFRGLPSPAAAGVVASLVLLHHELDLSGLGWAILFATPVLGVLMISRLPYAHLVNRWLEGSRPLISVVILVVVLFLATLHFHETVAGAFVVYALSGPVLFLVARASGRPRWAIREEEDEAGLEEPEPTAEEVPETDLPRPSTRE